MLLFHSKCAYCNSAPTQPDTG